MIARENVLTAKKYTKCTFKTTMRSAKTTARLTQRNIFKNNISAGSRLKKNAFIFNYL